ncbi:MAG: N-acetyltransferase family protein [Flavipsychrobacter sp.]
MNITIQLITPEDIKEVLEVYAPYIEETSISFEYEVPSMEEFTERVNAVTQQYPWLVAKQNGMVVGYAYGMTHRSRTAYQWSAEVAIYIAKDYRSKGVGKQLYEQLFELLAQQGYRTAFAGMTMPNERSEALHLSCGFEEIGVFKNIGFKNNEWHSVKWFQKQLGEYIAGIEKPRPIDKLKS